MRSREYARCANGHLSTVICDVLSILRDEVALCTPEKHNERIEGPHNGGEDFQGAEELDHLCGLLLLDVRGDAEVDDPQLSRREQRA